MLVWRRWLASDRAWTGSVVLVLVLGTMWLWWSRVPDAAGAKDAATAPRVGFQAPDFALDRLDGDRVMLSELRGHVVVINLWASWCGPCRAEMPALERVSQRYAGQGVVVLAVNQREGPEHVRSYADDLGLTLPILLDRDGAVAARYRMRALPTTFFVGPDGIIHDIVVGGPLAEALIASKVVAVLED